MERSAFVSWLRRSSLAAAERCGSPQPVDVWEVDVDEFEVDARDLSVLDGDERSRARAFSDAVERHRYIAMHVAVRRILADYLELAPHEVVFRRAPCPSCGGPHGRPEIRLEESSLHFSISRRAGRGLLAVASVPVGADIEVLAAPEIVAEVSSLFHRDERAEIESTPLSNRTAVFSTIWARKEALLKGMGAGITVDLSFCSLENVRPAIPRDWSIVTVEVAAGYVGAVAALAQDGVIIRHLPTAGLIAKPRPYLSAWRGCRSSTSSRHAASTH